MTNEKRKKTARDRWRERRDEQASGRPHLARHIPYRGNSSSSFYALTRATLERDVRENLDIQLAYERSYRAGGSLYLSQNAYALLMPWVTANVRRGSNIHVTGIPEALVPAFVDDVRARRAAIAACRSLGDVSAVYGGDPFLASLNSQHFRKFHAAFLHVLDAFLAWAPSGPLARPSDRAIWVIGL